MIRDDLPDLLNAYWRLVRDEIGDWAQAISRFLAMIERLRSTPVSGLDQEVERLPFAPLLVALGHRLNGEADASIRVLRETRPALVRETDLSARVDAKFTQDSIARLRARGRAATLAAFFASCGAAQDALELFGKLEEAGRRRTLWETYLVTRCLFAVGDLSNALNVALGGIDELFARRDRLDSGALRLNFGGRIGPSLLNLAASVDLQRGSDEDLRLALFLLDLGRDPLLAEMVHTITRAPLPILLKMDSIRQCWSAEAEAFQWADLLSRTLITHGPSAASRRFEEKLFAAKSATNAAQSHLHETAPSIYSMFFAPGRRLLRSPVERTLVADTQQLLSPDTCVIGYEIMGHDVIGWTLTHEHLSMNRLPLSAEDLTDHVTSVHASCRNGTLAVDAHLAPLADALLTAATDGLETRKRLVIVPSGPLRILPFSILPWRGHPLVVTHTSSVVPSLGLIGDLMARKARTVKNPKIAAFGNPANMRWTSPLGEVSQALNLQHAEREAREVAKLGDAQPRCAELATRTAVLESLREADIVHLATHAVFCSDAPLFSAFLLADGEQLSVLDLMAIESRCSLIVASACRTGESRSTSGNDVLGISRGLLACGASAAVVSLWPIDDAHTADFMIALYRGLLNGMDPARALQEAQIEFVKADPRSATRTRHLVAETSRPRRGSGRESWWAPFVVVGM